MQYYAVLGLCVLSGHAKSHLPSVGKLDGVPQQIHKNLAQASGVALQLPRDSRADIHDQFKALLLSRQRHCVHSVYDGVVGIEVDQIEGESFLALSILEKSRMSLMIVNSPPRRKI